MLAIKERNGPVPVCRFRTCAGTAVGAAATYNVKKLQRSVLAPFLIDSPHAIDAFDFQSL